MQAPSGGYGWVFYALSLGGAKVCACGVFHDLPRDGRPGRTDARLPRWRATKHPADFRPRSGRLSCDSINPARLKATNRPPASGVSPAQTGGMSARKREERDCGSFRCITRRLGTMARRSIYATWLLIVALSAASPVAAQEAAHTATAAEVGERVSLRLPLTVYTSSAAADLYTTHAALRRGAFYERNPMGAWIDHRPTALVAFSASADAAIVWGLHRWLAPKHSRVLRVGLYAAAGVRFWLAARNAAATRAYDRQMTGK